MKIKNYGWIKMMIITLMMAGISVMSFWYTYRLYFAPSTWSIHLNCTSQTYTLLVSWATYNGYTFDIFHTNNVTYLWHQVFSPFIDLNSHDGVTCGPGLTDLCYAVVGQTSNNLDVSWIHSWGSITIGNSGFIRTGFINLFTHPTLASSAITIYGGGTTNYLQTTGDLVISYYLGPCTSDSKAPLLTFTGMIPHSGAAYYGPQYNDRVYQFNLHDDDPTEATSWWFTHWWFPDTWSPDLDGGSWYANVLLVSSWISLSTFVFQIAVESWHTIPQQFKTVTITGVLNFTWPWPLTGFRDGVLSNWVLFYPYNFTWNRLNRDYYSVISTWDVRPGPSFIDDSNNVVFGSDYEEEVRMTWYVYDRSLKLSNVFSIAFNKWVKPWSSYVQGSGAYLWCGPAWTTGMLVNVVPSGNSGAYVERVNSGFYLKPFKVYLHDDRAGINSGKIVVTIIWTQNNIPVTIVLTGNDLSNPWTLTLTPFMWNGFVKPCLGSCTNVTSVSGSNRNYAVTVDYTGIFDPETSIDVSIDYQDMVGRTWYTVSCGKSYSHAPWASVYETWALYTPTNCGPAGSNVIWINTIPADSGAYIQKYNSGFYLRPFRLYAQDDWIGVSGWSLTLTVSRVEYTWGSLISHSKIFSGSDLSGWLHQYSIPITGGLDGHSLIWLQAYNYRIDVPDSSLYFPGYLAPESVVTVGLAYSDLWWRTWTPMSCTTWSQQQPWASNMSAGTYGTRITGCGPSNSQSIQVNTAPVVDSGAYLTKWNKGFYLEPFRVYMQDEWVGVDQSSIELVISGSILTASGSLSGITLIFDGPTLSSRTWLHQYSLATGYTWWGGTPLLDEQKYNYYIDMPQSTSYLSWYFAPETKVEVFVHYKDFYGNLLSQHTGDQVSCNYSAGLIPFVQNPSWTSDLHIYRYPYPQWGILTGFSISLEDEWAGINSGTIALRIQGQKLTGPSHVLTPVDELFTGQRLADLWWIHSYAVSWSSLWLMEDQIYNYTIDIPDSYSSYLSGDFFAPERDVTVSIESYSDFALRNWLTNSQTVNQSASPFVTTFWSTMDPLSTWDSAFPISTYGIPTTWFEFGVFDHWAGVDSWYNLVKIEWTRRWNLATYLFAASGSSLRSSTGWIQCGASFGNNCLATSMDQNPQQITGYDAYQAIHPTMWLSTGYFYQVMGHDIYFDYTSHVLASSPYTVSIYSEDLKPSSPNPLLASHSSAISTWFSCLPINRCSYKELTFVRWPDIFNHVNYTVTQDPLAPITGTTNNPFMGIRVNVIWSGVTIDTGNSLIDCSSWWVLGSDITLSFTWVVPLWGTPTSTWYAFPSLKVVDWSFELTGVNMDILIVK